MILILRYGLYRRCRDLAIFPPTCRSRDLFCSYPDLVGLHILHGVRLSLCALVKVAGPTMLVLLRAVP